MQLSRLEIKGFKSFGERIRIQFDDGVTGIVGPNGCGKSNVVDAIRWVLGEQKSRLLRSDKMENVIFNGTKNRKPAQVAEVALTFVNNKNILPAEYTEVTITRRYHRSGDSEYFINDVPCRLKDIRNLFLDTGIGPDSYAIIELKMVDEILTDKENSRRGLFEKAAGISKFKVRKKEALDRLEDVDKDLNRVEDLQHEIQKNLKSLERQAKQAEQFFALKDEYKQAGIAYARKALSRQRAHQEALQLQIEAEIDKRNALAQLLEEKETGLEREKQEALSTETHFYDKQKELNEHLNKLRSLENEKRLKSERLRFLEDKTRSLSSQISRDLEQQSETKRNIETLVERQQGLEKTLAESQSLLDDTRAAYQDQQAAVAELQQQTQSLTQIQAQQQQALFELNKNYEVKQTQYDTLSQEAENSQQEAQNLEERLTQYRSQYEDTAQDLQVQQQTLENLEAEEAENRQHIEALSDEIDQLRETLREKTRQLDAAQNEIGLLEALINNLEGFPDALKYLHQQPDWQRSEQGQARLLTDIIQVSPGYQKAIEARLEPYLNYYVTDTYAQAREAIALLKRSEKGKVGFFVLEALPTASNTEHQPQSIPATPAKEVVSVEEKYLNLIRRLLNQVFIVEDEIALEAPLPGGFVWVSKNGSLMQSQGQLLGGSTGKTDASPLARKQRLQSLQSQLETLQEEVIQLQTSLENKRQDLQHYKSQTLEEDIREAQQSLKSVERQAITLQTQLQQAQEQLARSAQKQHQAQERLQSLAAALESLEPQRQNQADTLQATEERLRTLQEQLEFENENLQLKTNRFNEQNIQYHQQKSQAENVAQELDYKQTALENIEHRLWQQSQDQQQASRDVALLLANIDDQNLAIEGLHEQTDLYDTQVKEAEKAFYTVRGRIAETEREIKEMQRQKEMLDSLIGELRNKLHETAIGLTSIQERLSAEFQMEAEDLWKEDAQVFVEANEHLDEEQLKRKVEDLRKRIDRMGAINPMAMESYQEMKDRFDFVETQRADLMESKMALLQTIKEMEDFAKTAFLEAFEAVRINFIRVFRSLFAEEDTADLVLTDPNEPLESKIEIIAKPKGKRPLTINQLSGGEKTLTATSLLFALYLLKPAPFCIFDEVDAPLDDTNTDKFNQIIKNFSKDSQFIIVTHNKRTMAMTDVMYGITMREVGVSMVVPVDVRTASQAL
jgi:chromosome segregation protein